MFAEIVMDLMGWESVWRAGACGPETPAPDPEIPYWRRALGQARVMEPRIRTRSIPSDSKQARTGKRHNEYYARVTPKLYVKKEE